MSFSTVVSSLLIILTFSTLVASPVNVTAVSKEYEIYKKIKPGMTLTSFAKVVYGKKYKDYLKKDNGMTVLKAELNYRDVQETYAQYYYSFFESYNKEIGYNQFKMFITFSTEENGKVLYVVTHGYDTFKKSSEHLYKNSKLKKGMSIDKVNSLISGEKMPQWYEQYHTDYSFLKRSKSVHASFYVKEDVKKYSIKNFNKLENIELTFKFNDKQKKFLLDSFN